MKKHHIGLHSQFQTIPNFGGDKKSETTISREAENRIIDCFKKLQNIIRKRKVTLYNVFKVYDKDKSGSISLKEFKKLIGDLSSGKSMDGSNYIFTED